MNSILNKRNLNTLNRGVFDNNLTFLDTFYSSETKYVPYYVINNSTVKYVEPIVLKYTKPNIKRVSTPVKKYDNFLDYSLRYNSRTIHIKSSMGNLYCDNILNTFFVYNEDYKNIKLLGSLVVESEYITSEDYLDTKTPVDIDKFKFFVDVDIMNDLRLKSFSKKFKEIFLKRFIEFGIDVVYTKNLEEKLYKPLIEPFEFKTAKEIMELINTGYKKFLK